MPDQTETDLGEKKVARTIGQIPRGVRLRMGTVTAVSVGPPRTVTATVGGVSIAGIPILDSADGVVGTNVWIASMGGGQMLAIGHSNGTGLRLAAGSEASLASTGHPFQIGPSTGVNLIMDSDEIQARNNGVASSLLLNPHGGSVVVGDGSTGSILVIGNDASLRDVNATDTLAIVSQTNTAIGALRLGLAGPRMSTDGNYIHLDSHTDIYLDADTLRLRNAAGTDRAYMGANELGIYGTRSLLFADYGGGWFMQDTTWIRAAGSKNIYTPASIRVGTKFDFDGSGYKWTHSTDTDTGLYYVEDGRFGMVSNGVIVLQAASGNCVALTDNFLRFRAYNDIHHAVYSSATPTGSGEASNGPQIQGYTSVWLRCYNGDKNLFLASGGNVFINAGNSYTNFSSREFKENIESLDPETCLAVVRQWRPVEFDWKEEHDVPFRHDHGFIAEEMNEITPTACTVEPEDSLYPGRVSAIADSKLTPWLAGSVQALLARVEQLEARIAELELNAA